MTQTPFDETIARLIEVLLKRLSFVQDPMEQAHMAQKLLPLLKWYQEQQEEAEKETNIKKLSPDPVIMTREQRTEMIQSIIDKLERYRPQKTKQ